MKELWIHPCGFNLNAANWTDLVLGTKSCCGRATAALHAALQQPDDVTVKLSFGTGASSEDDGDTSEALATMQRLGDWAEAHIAQRGEDLDYVIQNLLGDCRLDSQSMHTAEEIEFLLRDARAAGVNEVRIYTDQAHYPLVALIVIKKLGELHITTSDMSVGVYPADTMFADSRQTVIITPPANPQDPRHTLPDDLQPAALVARLIEAMRKQPNDVSDVLRLWDSALTGLERGTDE